jgi:hypothetical protein
MERGGASVGTADVVAGPQGAEPLTCQCELSDEFDEPGVVGVVPDGGATGGVDFLPRLKTKAMKSRNTSAAVRTVKAFPVGNCTMVGAAYPCRR